MKTDTPETEFTCNMAYARGVPHIPLIGFMEKLERERDAALKTLQSCGLHPDFHKTISDAAEGAREIIRSLRADLLDPPHDIQCAVLRKLGVEGFTKGGVAPTHRLVPLSEPFQNQISDP